MLIAPLDWGLGHATRCVPIIHKLLKKGMEVFLAGDGAVQALLQTEFPELPFLPLPGYRVQYGTNVTQTFIHLLRQIPKIKAAIRYENNWLQQMMAQYKFNAIISDNRYGLYHKQAHSILITHQLRIQAPLEVAATLLQRVHYRFIDRFNECWVPDVPGALSLAGALAHPRRLPTVPVRYIGLLSRFSASKDRNNNQHGPIMLLLSGPEPQRTLLEQKLLQQAANTRHPVVLVRGLPAQAPEIEAPPHVRIYQHLPAALLEQEIRAAGMIICRSGYSTIMDLATLGKKSILIPTPGQTEQQYLAQHLQQQGFALWRHQNDFDLTEALSAAVCFRYCSLQIDANDHLETVLHDLTSRINLL